MTERTTKGVPGTQTVHHLDLDRRNDDHTGFVDAQHPSGPSFTIAILGPRSSRAAAARLRVALADGHLALGQIADDHVDPGSTSPICGPGLGGVGPELLPVVEVEDGGSGAVPRRHSLMVCGAARLVGETGRGHPEEVGISDGVAFELIRVDLHVGSLRVAVEGDREMVRGMDLTET